MRYGIDYAVLRELERAPAPPGAMLLVVCEIGADMAVGASYFDLQVVGTDRVERIPGIPPLGWARGTVVWVEELDPERCRARFGPR